ncbi:hypothetical protein KEM54_006730, partial [Ascosphaera aggregata]
MPVPSFLRVLSRPEEQIQLCANREMSRRFPVPLDGSAMSSPKNQLSHSQRLKPIAPKDAHSKRESSSLAAHLRPEWAMRDSIYIRLQSLPYWATTWILYKTFCRPPPSEAFWSARRHPLVSDEFPAVEIVINLEVLPPQHRTLPKLTQAPGKILGELDVQLSFLGFGAFIDDKRLLITKSLQSGRIAVGAHHRQVDIFFQIVQRDDSSSVLSRREYRYRIPIAQLTHIYKISIDGKDTFALPLQSPPICHRKLQNPISTFSDSDSKWDSRNTWYRQTDIAINPRDLVSLPLTLHKPRAVIDIGRCTTIIFQSRQSTTSADSKISHLLTLLEELNVHTKEATDLDTLVTPPSNAWKWLDPVLGDSERAPSSSLNDLVSHDCTPLVFSVRYQLEVCLSHGYLSEFTVCDEFIRQLTRLTESEARARLEHVALNKMVLHDPMDLFKIDGIFGPSAGSIPPYCCRMRTARITPTTIYYNTPSVETSNRVLRRYIEFADRFLRVRFTDERLEGKIMSSYNNTMDEVFTRVKRALKNGIRIGDRHYEFLAFGNSQFREHGAYFFAGLPHLNASHIRAWMGQFKDIKNVAKHSARLGQCFSTTRAVTGTPVQVIKIPDIERNGYCFSDGVGRISRFLAQMIKAEFDIKPKPAEPPSVFQFRLGGCKGILAVSPEALKHQVHIRHSQYKFDGPQNGLEVIRYSQFSAASLNRQLIIVLSALGVPDDIFIRKLRSMLTSLEAAMTDEEIAVNLLTRYVDPNEATLLLASLISSGFQSSGDPFVLSLLQLWRSWQIKYLKEKAKIVVEQGACLLGCLDETASLRGYFHSRPPQDASEDENAAHLPEIFVQISRHGTGDSEVIQGLCILARNPSLHPGDIRVVRAVDIPSLHYLKDVVVLPQTGDRDVASMCSGGDLDGDEYVVIWDPDLLPRKWFEDPMDYTAPKSERLERDVTVDDITSFFVTYMKHDHLPEIAHAHLALADFLDEGVYNNKCMRLAELHSAAVDYNKTGIPANMPPALRPRKWPHFMEKRFKSAEQTYHSKKILGQLYDAVDRVEFEPKTMGSFDNRILGSDVEVSEVLLQKASETKVHYDLEMRRIMTQHQIKTEFEVFSTFALSHANLSNDFKFHEELGQISTNLRNRYWSICVEMAGGRDHRSLAPVAIAMYKVTANEWAAYQRLGKEGGILTTDDVPLISFPWVLHATLCEVARGTVELNPVPVSGTLEVISKDQDFGRADENKHVHSSTDSEKGYSTEGLQIEKEQRRSLVIADITAKEAIISVKATSEDRTGLGLTDSVDVCSNSDDTDDVLEDSVETQNS